MGLSSMTGFASAEGAENGRRWAWEARSVNSRGLDIRFRAPSGLEALEAEARRAAEARFRRGALQISLQTGRPEAASTLRLNEESLDQALAAMTALEGRVQAAPPRLEQILGLKGVLELVEAEEDETAKAAWRGALAAALEALLDDLARSRALEGEKLDKALSALLGEIEGLNEQARASAAAQPGAAGERLKRQVAEILAAAGSGGELDEGRLAQELAILAVKADVREEVDRLAMHIEAARALMAEEGPVGRKLDFLTQELNREANTLCAKTTDPDLKQIGLSLKAAIDQFREQVQNVE